MGRVSQQKNAKHNTASNNAATNGAKVSKQRKKHKVVLETAGNSNGKDQLRVELSFHTEPPPGYTFIPAGNTQLTAALKAFAKRGQHNIMAVSATPHATRHELSREVHRIGYHFPTPVVAQVCSHYGIRLDSSGRLVGENDSEALFMKIRQKGEVVLNENIRDQVTINTEAKEIIQDLFPKIPDNDLFQIIKTAFQLGDNKVGTAEEIPLVRRAQLAVVAHIRHNYTNYDKLLRQVVYNEARHKVEEPTLKRLIEWRGDDSDKDEGSRRAVDDAVREVVVLSDEGGRESSESEIEEGQVVEGDKMQIDSGRLPAPPVVATEHRALSPNEISSDDEPQASYRVVPQVNTWSRPTLMQSYDPVVRQQSRYAVWDQYRRKQIAHVSYPPPTTVVTRIPLDGPPYVHSAPQYQPHASFTHGSSQAPQSSFRHAIDDPPQIRFVRERSPQPLYRGEDGKLYERLPPPPENFPGPQRAHTPTRRHPQTMYAQQQRRSMSPRAPRPMFHQRTPSMNDDGSVLPSIEKIDSINNSPALLQNHFDEHMPKQYRHVERYSDYAQHGSNTQLIDLTESAEQATKRTRVDTTPPSPYLKRSSGQDAHMDVDRRTDSRRPLIDLQAQVEPSSPRRGRTVVTMAPRKDQHSRPQALLPESGPYRVDYQDQPRHHALRSDERRPEIFPRQLQTTETRVLYEAVDPQTRLPPPPPSLPPPPHPAVSHAMYETVRREPLPPGRDDRIYEMQQPLAYAQPTAAVPYAAQHVTPSGQRHIVAPIVQAAPPLSLPLYQDQQPQYTQPSRITYARY